ncbi:MAG: hypothetical protein ABSB63_08610 [Spirochaetia bacterium]|jgi:acyl-CoA synthetase (AMP-forming)/AMP-acid ligase II
MENVTQTLGQVLERQAALLSQKEFIVFPDRNLRFTYAEFDQRVNNLAALAGVVISNPSRTDPIVMLKHFGPGNPKLKIL